MNISIYGYCLIYTIILLILCLSISIFRTKDETCNIKKKKNKFDYFQFEIGKHFLGSVKSIIPIKVCCHYIYRKLCLQYIIYIITNISILL